VVLLLWVYYSAQIFLLGAEFTQVYANQYGSRVRPSDNAEAVTEQERVQQGLVRSAADGLPARALAVAPRPTALDARPAIAPGPQTRPAATPRPSYLVSLMTFIIGLGAGATLGGRQATEGARRRPRRR
jgi:membrane protein